MNSPSSCWRELARGATIGYARIERFAPVAVNALRVVIEEATAPIAMPTLRAYAAP